MSTVRSLSIPMEQSHSSVVAQAAWITGFAALTAVGAQIQIPHQPVPYTLQTFFVILGAAFLGSRNAAISQILYLAVGFLGAPVFAGMSGGLSFLAAPTVGYLIGFPIGAVVIGLLMRSRRGYLWTLFSMFAGLTVIFACGTVGLYATYFHNIEQSIIGGFLIFSWWDLLKLSAAAGIYQQVARRYPKLPA